MIKYVDYSIVFQEVPDEISLALEISGCPHLCKNCHSPHLREDIGVELTCNEIDKLIVKNKHISCICFMGGDNRHQEIIALADYIHSKNLLVAMYSGDDIFDEELSKHLDYYKVGSYQEDKGPLNKITTNQVMYKMKPNKQDITYRFRKGE